MAEYGWRASMDRTMALRAGTVSWSGPAAEQPAADLRGRKKASMPVVYRAMAMMLALFLALRSGE